MTTVEFSQPQGTKKKKPKERKDEITQVYYVESLSEALSLSVLNNIKSGSFKVPKGVPDDSIPVNFGGDAGKGITQFSVSTLTREHPNSSLNSVIVALYEKPALDTYHNLKQIVNLFGHSQFESLMSRGMFNIVFSRSDDKIRAHVSLLLLDKWGQNRANHSATNDPRHKASIAETPPSDPLSKLKWEFDMRTSQAHYDEHDSLSLIDSSEVSSAQLTSIDDWQSFCEFDSSERRILISNRSFLTFDGVVGIVHNDQIVCNLRIQYVSHQGQLLIFSVLGRALFYPAIPIQNMQNVRCADGLKPVPLGSDALFSCHPQSDVQSFTSDDSPTELLWISKRATTTISGDLDFLCKLWGHNGSNCGSPCCLCHADRRKILSEENKDNSLDTDIEYRCNQSVLADANEYQKSHSLPKSRGVGHPPLIPVFAWCFALCTLHMMEGIFSRLQQSLFHALREKVNPDDAESNCLKEIHTLQLKQRKVQRKISEYHDLERLIDTGYDAEQLELSTSMDEFAALEELKSIAKQIKVLREGAAMQGEYKAVFDFMEEKSLIQHDYRPNSVKGCIVKRNIAFYVAVSEKIEDNIDEDLGREWKECMEKFALIHSFINKHRGDNKAEYGLKISASELSKLKEAIHSFIPMYYQFVADYDEITPCRDKGELKAGVKVHYLWHVMDYIALHGGMRPSFYNEERVENMVQFGSKTLRPYHHFFGAKRLWCAMRQANLRALMHVFFGL